MSGDGTHSAIAGDVHGPVLQAGDIHGSVYIDPAATGSVVVPRQLPRTISRFTNRDVERDTLTRLINEADTNNTMAICIIDGSAGIGKTALALHWSHQLKERFPDGHLYINLSGFDPVAEPAPPHGILAEFLSALGVPNGRIPDNTPARAALYRSAIHGKKILIVLDNAADSEQVRPLLPNEPKCVVVVTSRSQLDGLVIRDGARRMTLDALTTTDARALLSSYLGDDRIRAEPAVVSEIIQRCAHLPLALSIVAAHAEAHPTFSLSVLVSELRDEQNCLDALEVEDNTGVRAVFSWSYQRLSPDAARMFRLLGLPAGPDISLHAAAALVALPVRRTSRLLDELARAHILEHRTPGRYRFHDLLRIYAAERAHQDTSDAERKAALQRLLDWYLHTAHSADAYLTQHSWPTVLQPPYPNVVPGEINSYQQALEWFTAERAVLIVAVKLAARLRFDQHAWRLATVLNTFLNYRGHWPDNADIQEIALLAAERNADQASHALAAHYLGEVYLRLGRHADAALRERQALALCSRLDDRIGQAHAHASLSVVYDLQDQHTEALDHARQALALFRTASDHAGEASALDRVGWNYARLG